MANFSAPFPLDLWDGAVDCVINSCKIRTNVTIIYNVYNVYNDVYTNT